jgi:hypothetical protein
MIRAERVEARVVDFQISGNSRATPHGALAWEEISHLEKQYPDFRGWYFGKVIPGIIRGERCVLTSTHKGRLAGLAIAKRGDEKKLCTLWVDSDVRRLGVASKLADRAFDWMGTDQPLFTVPEEHLQKFSSLLSRWEFTQTAKILGYYRALKVEYVFNGKLEAKYSS